MLPGFCRDEVKVLRAPVPSTGRRERDWSSATSETIAGCSVQPSTTSGSVVSREDASMTMEVYMPPGSDIRPGDRVEWDGITWEVIGMPRTNRSPLGSRDNVQATITRWRG